MECLCCGKKIPYGGRADKKFCTVECKNKFHNMQKVTLTMVKQDVRHHLTRNYRILMSLLRANVTRILISQLNDMGFDLRFVTRVESTGGNWVFYCYDVSYVVDEHKIYHIQQNTRYHVELASSYLLDDEWDESGEDNR